MLKIIVVFIALAISVIGFKYIDTPFIWIPFSWFIAAIFLVSLSTKISAKKIWLIVSAIALTFGILEGYFVVFGSEFNRINIKGDNSAEYSMPDDLLGSVPIKNISKSVSRYYKDDLLYSVKYTIDDKGMRISTPSNEVNFKDQKCVIFFGGSFTFGHGVNDDQSLPYLISKLSDGKFETFNLAFNGYGPHQMLAILENSLEKEAIDCVPQYAIYTGIINHVRRTGGEGVDKHGPRYVFNSDGQIVRDGNFDSDGMKTDKSFKDGYINIPLKILSKSTMVTGLANEYIIAQYISSYMNLYMSVVEKSMRIFKNRYPDSDFVFIFWDRHKGG